MRRSIAGFFGSCLVLLTGVASAQPAEQDYPAGALGVEAMQRGDWTRAEQALRSDTVAADDAGRLLNLGEVYYRTGRMSEAFATWERAAKAAPILVHTRDGRVASTATLAQQALARRRLATR